MINEEQHDCGHATLGAALAVLPSVAEELHPLDRVEIGPVTSTYRRYHDRTLARSRVASDNFWSGMERDHSRQQ